MESGHRSKDGNSKQIESYRVHDLIGLLGELYT